MKKTIKAWIEPDEGGFTAQCFDINVVTQGDTLDETLANLREAVTLYLDGEDLAELGFVEDPCLLVTIETELESRAG